MRACGLLDAILPEWKHVEHLVVRDFYHHYTVDEHTIVTLESLEDLASAKTGPMLRFVPLLVESRDELWMLRLALLFHDLGKGTGGNHEIESVRLATEFLRRSNFGEVESATILFLIQRHLDLSTLLQSRNLSDPATAVYSAELTSTEERLRLLTLMTLADINAVNPSALTPWRLEQLWRLYRVTQRELTRELSASLEPETAPVSPEENPILAEFLDGLPRRYLFTHSMEQAAAQAKLYRTALEHRVALQIE
jgi:[protein-PII] uridylyltransferase